MISFAIISIIIGSAVNSPDTTVGKLRPPEEVIQFKGNLVLPNEVYFALLNLDDEIEANKETARLVGNQIQRFLLRAGYELAKVHIGIQQEKIIVKIDEGRLARVVFRGEGSIKSIRAKAMLDIPHKVFNSLYLKRQLNRLADDLDLAVATYKLVRVKPTGRGLPKIPDKIMELSQLIKLTDLLGVVVDLEEESELELHIILRGEKTAGRTTMKLQINREDGFVLYGAHSRPRLAFDDDSWMLYGQGGITKFSRLDANKKRYYTWTAFRAGAKWELPDLEWGIRQFIWASTDFQKRQRLDLDIRSYLWERTRVTVNVRKVFVGRSYLLFRGGIQQRRLSNIEPYLPIRFFERGLFFAGELYLLFDQDGLRINKAHSVFLEACFLPAAELDYSWRLRVNYQKWFAISWDDLIFRANGKALGGDILFPQEIGVGDYLRAVFGRVFYVKKVGAATAEYRFSLQRDVLKLGPFVDFAVFETAHNQHLHLIIAPRFDAPIMYGASMGLGFHVLIISMFRLSLFGAVGFASDGQRSGGVSLKLVKEF